MCVSGCGGWEYESWVPHLPTNLIMWPFILLLFSSSAFIVCACGSYSPPLFFPFDGQRVKGSPIEGPLLPLCFSINAVLYSPHHACHFKSIVGGVFFLNYANV